MNDKGFKFAVRLAAACDKAGVPYDIEWHMDAGKVTIVAEGAKIPDVKALPKPKVNRAADWKPRIHEAEYSLGAYVGNDKNSTEERRHPGFVILHSCGLSLVCPSENGEWNDSDSDPNGQTWSVTHTASGLSIGGKLKFKKAVERLLAASESAVDWNNTTAELKANPQAAQVLRKLLAA